MGRAAILVISVMPLLAVTPQGPISAQVTNASVVFGPGIIQDKSGESAAPKFQPKLKGEVQVAGQHSKTKPHFRFWLVKARDAEKLKRASPLSVKAKTLVGSTEFKPDSGYSFDIDWFKGAVDPEDRLYVEVFQGRRRAATAISAIQSHYLPVSRPRGHEANN